MSSARALSNLQQELLKIYSSDVAEADLLNIRRLLARYFAAKAIAEADKLWDERSFDEKTIDQWLKEG